MNPEQYELTLYQGLIEINIKYYGNDNILIEYKSPNNEPVSIRVPRFQLTKFLEMIDA